MPKNLYRNSDLTTPVVGEFSDWQELERAYLKGLGAWKQPGTTVAVPLSCMIGAPSAPRRVDTDLFEVLLVCLAENGIEFVHKYQRSGTCVGQAAATGADIVCAVSWLLDHKFPGRASVACCYAGSRVDVAGRPGTWQGSNGSWVAEWVRKWGVATLKELDLPETSTVEDERLALRWTSTRAGVPDKFEVIAKTRPVLSTPLVETVTEAAVAIEGGAPVIDCSNLIPSGRTDKNGVSRVSRGGGHATVFSAVRWRGGEMEFKYTNSWSKDWGDNGHVWIPAGDAQRILDQKDSYAFVGINGLDPVEWRRFL